jgi:hypothetical protein
MKTVTCTLFFATTLVVMLAVPLYGQNGSITNTLGTGGAFTVKYGSTTFLTLSQTNGNFGLNRNLTLPATTDATQGVILKGGKRFIHDYHPAGTSGYNTFVGQDAGNFTMTASNQSEASQNSAFGYSCLSSITSGAGNSGFGCFNLIHNTTGSSNSAFGNWTFYLNTTGSNNCAFGLYSLAESTGGNSNSAFGAYSLRKCQGSGNCAIGFDAGNLITSGSYNIAIGVNAQVPDGTADNQVRIGNSFITHAGIEVAWTITSDRRRKEDIQSLNHGLDFVSSLRPVSYTRKNDAKHRTEYGFIAQEVEQVLKDRGIQNSGMLTIDDKGFYELRYNDLFAPVVKAIQELKTENDALKSENDSMKKELSSLRVTVSEQIKEMRSMVLKIARTNATEGNVSSVGGSR